MTTDKNSSSTTSASIQFVPEKRIFKLSDYYSITEEGKDKMIDIRKSYSVDETRGIEITNEINRILNDVNNPISDESLEEVLQAVMNIELESFNEVCFLLQCILIAFFDRIINVHVIPNARKDGAAAIELINQLEDQSDKLEFFFKKNKPEDNLPN